MARHGTRQLRIIGGRWRGRRLRFAAVRHLRPTSDRNRETLFNWLLPLLPGARCLDLFAGSGALGFEAASRGAAEVIMVEQARAAVSILRDNARLLGADNIHVRQCNALRLLDGPCSEFDIVFLDPPFESTLLETCCARLDQRGWLRPGACIYVETGSRRGLPALPAGWTVWRQRTAGQVLYALLRAPGDEQAGHDILQSSDDTGEM